MFLLGLRGGDAAWGAIRTDGTPLVSASDCSPVPPRFCPHSLQSPRCPPIPIVLAPIHPQWSCSSLSSFPVPTPLPPLPRIRFSALRAVPAQPLARITKCTQLCPLPRCGRVCLLPHHVPAWTQGWHGGPEGNVWDERCHQRGPVPQARLQRWVSHCTPKPSASFWATLGVSSVWHRLGLVVRFCRESPLPAGLGGSPRRRLSHRTVGSAADSGHGHAAPLKGQPRLPFSPAGAWRRWVCADRWPTRIHHQAVSRADRV